MEERKIDPIEDLKNIRNMMEKSSKFLSLSGLSGVFAGLTALTGAYFAYRLLHNFKVHQYNYFVKGTLNTEAENLSWHLMILAGLILVTAVGIGLIFTYIKARKNGQKLNHPIAFKVFWSVMTPLFFGGLFTILLYWNGAYTLIASSTLIFYGLALLNASKYVNIEIKYLAISELILGLLAGFFIENTLIFWAVGFGVMHIFYGAVMYFKYDRK